VPPLRAGRRRQVNASRSQRGPNNPVGMLTTLRRFATMRDSIARISMGSAIAACIHNGTGSFGRAAIGDKQRRYLVRGQPDKGKFSISLDASAFTLMDPISVVTQHKTPTAVPPVVLFPTKNKIHSSAESLSVARVAASLIALCASPRFALCGKTVSSRNP
jgi:hypothetical protein